MTVNRAILALLEKMNFEAVFEYFHVKTPLPPLTVKHKCFLMTHLALGDG